MTFYKKSASNEVFGILCNQIHNSSPIILGQLSKVISGTKHNIKNHLAHKTIKSIEIVNVLID